MKQLENLSKPMDAEKKEKKIMTSRQAGVLLLAGVALASSLTVVGCSAKNTENVISGTTTIEATTTPSSNSTATSSETTSQSIEATKPYEKYTNAVEQYMQMDITEFNNLPREERMSPAQYLVDRTAQIGAYDALYRPVGGSENGSIKYALTPHNSKKNDGGQEILNGFLYNLECSYAQFTPTDDYIKPFDFLSGQKVLSLAFYNVNEDTYHTNFLTATVDFEKKLNEPMAGQLKDKAISCSGLKHGHDTDSGEAVEYKDVVYEVDSNGSPSVNYARYIYQEFVSYDRSKKADWLLEMVGPSRDVLLNNSHILPN